jgi:uncharacterized protein YaeQ
MRTKFTFNITCNGRARKIVLAQASSELTQHVAMKLLAYLLFFDREPQVEVSVGQHYKPDLVCVDEDGHVTLWVDCGSTALQKLDRVATKNRRAEIFIVKPTRGLLEPYRERASRRVRRDERVRYLAFEDGFVNVVVEHLQRSNDLMASVSADQSRVDLVLNGTELGTEVVWL